MNPMPGVNGLDLRGGKYLLDQWNVIGCDVIRPATPDKASGSFELAPRRNRFSEPVVVACDRFQVNFPPRTAVLMARKGLRSSAPRQPRRRTGERSDQARAEYPTEAGG